MKNSSRFNSHKSFNKSRDFKSKNFKSFNKQNQISIEYILDLFQRNQGCINVSSLNLDNKNNELFFKKLNLLSKFDFFSYNKNDNLIKLNIQKIGHNLDKYCIVKIIKHIAQDHYLVNFISLVGNITEEETIFTNLNTTLLSKEIFAEISTTQEKILTTPIFYLDAKNINTTNLSSSVFDNDTIKGVLIKTNNVNYIAPLNYKSKYNFLLNNSPANIKEGSIIKAKLIETFNSQKEADFVELISDDKISTTLSMLSIHQYNIPFQFSSESIQQAQQAQQCKLENRKDITHIPLVTIDDEDAKDFDDAIYAEKLQDNSGGFKIYVAIADVSYYVPINSPLDIEAQKRGNSVYLPGMVVPMLPKELSNGWCSLNPNENRGCLLAEIIINRNGLIDSFEFSRCLMKSNFRLTYNEVQNALDGNPSDTTLPILNTIIKPLYECYSLLNQAKIKRNALDLNSKEIKIILDKDENILDIKLRKQLTSHKIVEEFMICANVSAAKFLHQQGLSQKGLTIYRIHEKPSLEKITEYINVLKSFDIVIKNPNEINGSFFNNILEKHKNDYFYPSLSESTLRCQSQAKYDILNAGHFGLALKEYAHFTSPIRRYADLMVHRAILNIIDNQEFNFNRTQVSDIANHISITERIAFNAENAAKDRILTKWLSLKIDEEFDAYISSITNAGIFINLINNGASGLIPMRTISNTYAYVDIQRHTIKDKSINKVYKLGDKITAILKEADEIRGLMIFNLKKTPTKHSYKTKY